MKNKEFYKREIEKAFLFLGWCEFRQKYIWKTTHCHDKCNECSLRLRKWLEAEYMSNTEQRLRAMLDEAHQQCNEEAKGCDTCPAQYKFICRFFDNGIDFADLAKFIDSFNEIKS